MREIKFRIWFPRLKSMLYVPRIRKKDLIIMQYIGLRDKYYKDIYEGDIVKVRDSYTGIIFHGIVSFQDASFVITNEVCTYYCWIDYEVEVLGNIFENQDILKIREEIKHVNLERLIGGKKLNFNL